MSHEDVEYGFKGTYVKFCGQKPDTTWDMVHLMHAKAISDLRIISCPVPRPITKRRVCMDFLYSVGNLEGLPGGQVVKALDCRPRGPRFQPHYSNRDFFA